MKNKLIVLGLLVLTATMTGCAGMAMPYAKVDVGFRPVPGYWITDGHGRRVLVRETIVRRDGDSCNCGHKRQQNEDLEVEVVEE